MFNVNAALYYEYRDSNTLAKHMVNLYKNKDLRNTLSVKANANSKSFSWEKTATETVALLKNT